MVQEIHEMQQNTSTNPSNIYDHASVEGQSQKRKKKYMKCSRKSPHVHSSLFFYSVGTKRERCGDEEWTQGSC
jgi:hypothetical protein